MIYTYDILIYFDILTYFFILSYLYLYTRRYIQLIGKNYLQIYFIYFDILYVNYLYLFIT